MCFVPMSGFAGKLNAIHSVRHHDIAEQEINVLATLEYLDGLRTITGAKNPIAEFGQHFGGGFQEILVVLDHKDSLRAAGYGLGLNGFDLGVRHLRGFGQVQSDRGPHSRRHFLSLHARRIAGRSHRPC